MLLLLFTTFVWLQEVADPLFDTTVGDDEVPDVIAEGDTVPVANDEVGNVDDERVVVELNVVVGIDEDGEGVVEDVVVVCVASC